MLQYISTGSPYNNGGHELAKLEDFRVIYSQLKILAIIDKLRYAVINCYGTTEMYVALHTCRQPSILHACVFRYMSSTC